MGDDLVVSMVKRNNLSCEQFVFVVYVGPPLTICLPELVKGYGFPEMCTDSSSLYPGGMSLK